MMNFAVEPLTIAKHKVRFCHFSHHFVTFSIIFSSQVLLQGTDADGNETLTWNVAWVPASHKVSIPAGVTRWTKKEADVAKKVVDVDRSFQIDASIVRIMQVHGANPTTT